MSTFDEQTSIVKEIMRGMVDMVLACTAPDPGRAFCALMQRDPDGFVMAVVMMKMCGFDPVTRKFEPTPVGTAPHMYQVVVRNIMDVYYADAVFTPGSYWSGVDAAFKLDHPELKHVVSLATHDEWTANDVTLFLHMHLADDTFHNPAVLHGALMWLLDPDEWNTTTAERIECDAEKVEHLRGALQRANDAILTPPDTPPIVLSLQAMLIGENVDWSEFQAEVERLYETNAAKFEANDPDTYLNPPALVLLVLLGKTLMQRVVDERPMKAMIDQITQKYLPTEKFGHAASWLLDD